MTESSDSSTGRKENFMGFLDKHTNSQGSSSGQTSKSLTRKSSHQDTLFVGPCKIRPDDFIAEKLFQFVPKECIP